MHVNTSLVQWYMVMLEFTTHHEPLCTPCTQQGIAEHPVDNHTMASATCTAAFQPLSPLLGTDINEITTAINVIVCNTTEGKTVQINNTLHTW